MDTTIWTILLVVNLVIVLVVAALLLTIIATAARVAKNAAGIWVAGKDIASNTVQIWQLQKTNAVASSILSVANDIAAGAGSIDSRLAALQKKLGA